MDKFQFAYSEGLGVDDAVLTLLHFLHSHFDNFGTTARLLFVNFSSAFNTIQRHLPMKKLMNTNVNANLILWIQSFLTKKRQYVHFNGTLSDLLEISTGALQGCVLSAVLFIIYTTDCRSMSKHAIIKYADDTVIVGMISNGEDVYTSVDEINRFVKWCDENYVNLNVKKTKEMIVDYSSSPTNFNSVTIKEGNVEIVEEYKYLGNIIDNKLKGNLNVSRIHAKCNQRLYFLRKLKNTKVVDYSNIILQKYHPVCIILLYFILV